MSQSKENVFDLGLFRRLMTFIRPYRPMFIISFITVVGLSIFGAARPYVLQQAIDNNIANKDFDGFIFYIVVMLVLLVLEVICNLLFILLRQLAGSIGGSRYTG